MEWDLKRFVKRRVAKRADRAAAYPWETLADRIAYRLAIESQPALSSDPSEQFGRVSDPFWFWLCTEGYRRSPFLRSTLPAMPEEDVQLQFTGNTGDAVLEEAFAAYLLFRDQYQRHVGPIDQASAILDFGCGWGRIIRFFLKDIEPSRLWGVDPVTEMIDICRRDNKWCNFEVIGTRPPTPFPDAQFDLIYSYSVFSHLSETMHRDCLVELTRLLKSGGLLMVTTRPRDFIEYCGRLRENRNLKSIHPGPASSAAAFLDTERSLATYDNGDFCFTPLVSEEEWLYWGEAAISQAYVTRNWSEHLEILAYIDDRDQCPQNVIVMTKT